MDRCVRIIPAKARDPMASILHLNLLHHIPRMLPLPHNAPTLPSALPRLLLLALQLPAQRREAQHVRVQRPEPAPGRAGRARRRDEAEQGLLEPVHVLAVLAAGPAAREHVARELQEGAVRRADELRVRRRGDVDEALERAAAAPFPAPVEAVVAVASWARVAVEGAGADAGTNRTFLVA